MSVRKDYLTSGSGEAHPAFSVDDIGLHNVSDISWLDRMRVLYPHASKKDMRGICATLHPDQSLILFTIPMNNQHWTSGLFTNKENQQPILSALATAMRKESPRLRSTGPTQPHHPVVR